MTGRESLTSAKLERILIETVLCVAGSDPQRGAFLAGYNGYERPSPASDAMRECYRRGEQARETAAALRARASQERSS